MLTRYLARRFMGSEYTLVDGYAPVFYGWGMRGGFPIPMNKLGAYTARKERVLARPTAWKILEAEQSVLVKIA